MKKYFNKGLIYQWFNSAKMMIILGIVVWGFFSNVMVEGNINDVTRTIASKFESGYRLNIIFNYGILGIIFALIHFMSQGINKRYNNMFLTGAPYTKKQIKYNEFICLMINLVIFIAVQVYICVMAYIRDYELMAIVDGYFTALGIEVLRMILFGTAGILILLIIDSMFSNTIMGIICMISILPASLFFIIYRFLSILDYVPAGINISMLDKFGSLIGESLFYRKHIYLLEDANAAKIDSSMLFSEAAIVILLIVVLLIVYYIMQNRFKVESSTKMFTSKLNEKIIVIITSIGAGTAVSTMFLTSYIYDLRGAYHQPLAGTQLIKVLSIDLGVTIFVALIVYKLIRRFVNSLQ